MQRERLRRNRRLSRSESQPSGPGASEAIGRRVGILGRCCRSSLSASSIAATALSAETPSGGSLRAMRNARSRACGSVRSLIQPCSSHSRIAPVSSRTDLAQPSIVRVAGRRSFVIETLLRRARRVLGARFGSGLLTQGRSRNRGNSNVPPVPPPRTTASPYAGRYGIPKLYRCNSLFD